MKIKSFNPLLVALAGLALSFTSANAATLIYESFSQAVGGLGGKAGGTGLSGNWAASAGSTVTAGSLSYGSPDSLLTNGGKVGIASGNNASISVGSTLADAGVLANGATLWFSFLLNTDTLGSTNDNAAFAFGTATVGAGNNIPMTSTGNGVGISWDRGQRLHASQWNNGARTINGTSNTINKATTTLVVASITWGETDTDDEILTIYLPGANLAQPTALETYSISAKDQSLFNVISFARKGETGEVDLIDEIRFGTTYASVTPIPEPTTALLGGLGFLALLRRRR